MSGFRDTAGTSRRGCSSVQAGLLALLMASLLGIISAQSVRAEDVIRHHGFRLDDRHLLLLEQRHRDIKIGIATRSRNVGDTARTRTRDESSDTIDRFGTVDFLVRLSAEVLKPSAPNYLRNPGERYRITIEGLSVDPDFSAVIEADAIVARTALLSELDRLGARTSGIQREALHYAGPYALQILNETALMPAPIPTSIQESKAGRIRFDNPALQRESLEAGRKLYTGAKPKPTTLSPLAGRSTDSSGGDKGAKDR